MTHSHDVVTTFLQALTARRTGPFFGTPCGVLAPLYSALEDEVGLTTLSREDTAVGVAAGAALAGKSPVVLMQNSGFGQSINAYASLVVPYRLNVLTVVSLRGQAPDGTAENKQMGRLTELIVRELGCPYFVASPDGAPTMRVWLAQDASKTPSFLLVPPTLFGWHA